MTEKIKVLVVEDNPVNFRLLSMFIEEAGLEVLHAEEGYVAMEVLTSQPDIGVILLDRILPNMDGLDVLKNLKTNARTSRIPVIMLTAAMSPRQRDEAMLYGAHACLPKPYNKEQIISAIQNALGENSGDRRRR